TKLRYLELVRTRKNRIISNIIEPEVLEYKINHSKNFRGE
ncbi:AAA family ATPase, partial [Acinetobacter baumannii]